MYSLKTISCFDSAHFLSGYEGKCSNIHGHRWEVEIEVASKELDKEGNFRGMIVDFSKLKEDLKAITEFLDHCLIIEKGTLKQKTMDVLRDEGFRVEEVDFRPTAENFSQFFYVQMQKKGYNVLKSTVYETPNNCATFYQE